MFFNSIEGPFTPVSIALKGTFFVIVFEPFIHIVLYYIKRVIVVFSKGWPEEN